MSKIIPYYLSGSQFIEADTAEYTLTEDDDYFTFSEWTRETKALKLNIVVDNSDKYDTPDEKNALELNKQIEFYGKVDNIDFEYTYDAMGNRTYKSQKMYREDRSILIKEDEDNYSYTTNKRFIESDNTYNYVFDEDGFLKEKNEIANVNNKWLYTWNSLGNLRKVTKYENNIETYYEEYIYDEGGQRVKTITVDKEVVNIYDGLNKLFERITDSEGSKDTHYVYALGELQCVVEDGNYQYQYQDVLGSTRFVTDNTGNILQESIFSPFGLEILNAYNNGGKYKYHYAGHEYMNLNTGIQYMQARYMDPILGRFLSSDPVRQGINHYIYAGNNPTTNIDPDGLLYWNPGGPGYNFNGADGQWLKASLNKSSHTLIVPDQYGIRTTDVSGYEHLRAVEYADKPKIITNPVKKAIYDGINNVADFRDNVFNEIGETATDITKNISDFISPVSGPVKDFFKPFQAGVEVKKAEFDLFRSEHKAFDVGLNIAEGYGNVVKDRILKPVGNLALSIINPAYWLGSTAKKIYDKADMAGFIIADSFERDISIFENVLERAIPDRVAKFEKDFQENPWRTGTEFIGNTTHDIGTFVAFANYKDPASKIRVADYYDEAYNTTKQLNKDIVCGHQFNINKRGAGHGPLIKYQKMTGGSTYYSWQKNGLTKFDPFNRAQFMKAFNESASNASRIHFGIDSLNLTATYNLGSLPISGVTSNFTAYEFYTIMNNSSYFNKTFFWQNGKVVSAANVLRRTFGK